MPAVLTIIPSDDAEGAMSLEYVGPPEAATARIAAGVPSSAGSGSSEAAMVLTHFSGGMIALDWS